MAIFLTSIDILDTGFLRVGRSTPSARVNQLGTSSRVNSGSALRLKGVTIEFDSTSNLDATASPAQFNTSTIVAPQSAAVSSNPTRFTMNIKINSTNTDTSNEWGINDMSLVAHLLQLPHTKGFKAIYYPVDLTATGDTRNLTKQLTHYLGDNDTTQSQGDIDITLWTGATSASSKDLTDVNYVAVRFDSCKITQTPSQMIDITLSGVITE